MALPANQLAGRIPDSYINMWAASLLRGQWNNQVDNIRKNYARLFGWKLVHFSCNMGENYK